MSSAVSIFAPPTLPDIDPQDFSRAAALLKKHSGIVLGEHKQDMAERALGLRAKAMGLASVTQYLHHLERYPDTAEWEAFVNVFTINHTAFFREAHHFDILARYVETRVRPLSIWSAACSTGEEPYSIAIQLRETLPNPDHQVSILATDIDTRAIEVAESGVYTLDRVKLIPDPLLKKYFQRGTGMRAGMARVKSNARNMVSFEAFNLASADWQRNTRFDVIFCRNTLIYFDKETQTQILDRFARVLKPGGLLFAGHSENLTYLTDSFRLLGQTVYELMPGGLPGRT
ncbi:MAG TPA: CheR family methyltransferase [Burkholderiaceae bacterium]|nr:CheR family methyltransferase [Burkholderiaceae bacterium]